MFKSFDEEINYAYQYKSLDFRSNFILDTPIYGYHIAQMDKNGVCEIERDFNSSFETCFSPSILQCFMAYAIKGNRYGIKIFRTARKLTNIVVPDYEADYILTQEMRAELSSLDDLVEIGRSGIVGLYLDHRQRFRPEMLLQQEFFDSRLNAYVCDVNARAVMSTFDNQVNEYIDLLTIESLHNPLKDIIGEEEYILMCDNHTPIYREEI